MIEFTGERVVQGHVAPDLWNEHLARYRFAARLAGGKRVLDIGCGSGYGSAELAKVAGSVVGLDASDEAVKHAAGSYAAPQLTFRTGDASHLPFDDGSFDLVIAFEVIEHLEDWQSLLNEAKRVLTSRGQLMVSTPNRLYYAETRKRSGPNPFHVHEFTFEEFTAALEGSFTSVRMFLQNHVASIAFQPVASQSFNAAELSVERQHTDPEQSHFFVAVCAQSHQTGSPTYLYVPAISNVLRERERHIDLLEVELQQKDAWLEKSKSEHAALVQLHQEQAAELASRTKWAHQLQNEIDASRVAIEEYEKELERERGTLEQERAAAAAVFAGYEEKIASIERELADVTETGGRLAADLRSRVDELARCVELLHRAEASVEERTKWALDLQGRIDQLEETLRSAGKSRWLRLGHRFGVGPDLGAF